LNHPTASALARDWQQQNGGTLDPDERVFLDQAALHAPQLPEWSEQPGRHFDRLAVEGPADCPTLVCYFHDELRRPGLPLAYEWPLRPPGYRQQRAEAKTMGDPSPNYTEWMGNLSELLAEAGTTLPTRPGPDGIACR